jgi:hypothetical protein
VVSKRSRHREDVTVRDCGCPVLRRGSLPGGYYCEQASALGMQPFKAQRQRRKSALPSAFYRAQVDNFKVAGAPLPRWGASPSTTSGSLCSRITEAPTRGPIGAPVLQKRELSDAGPIGAPVREPASTSMTSPVVPVPAVPVPDEVQSVDKSELTEKDRCVRQRRSAKCTKMTSLLGMNRARQAMKQKLQQRSQLDTGDNPLLMPRSVFRYNACALFCHYSLFFHSPTIPESSHAARATPAMHELRAAAARRKSLRDTQTSPVSGTADGDAQKSPAPSN